MSLHTLMHISLKSSPYPPHLLHLHHRRPHTHTQSLQIPSSHRQSQIITRRENCKAVGRQEQVGGNDEPSSSSRQWTQSMIDFGKENFLPLALVSGVAFGLANPTLGFLAHKLSFSTFSTFGIFFISGLMLRTAELDAALEAWPAGIFGLASILLITPFISKLILQMRLAPFELVTGLAIFCCMPTTLSSGVTLTQLAGGNSALALGMTVLSNLLGIIMVPFSLSRLIGTGTGISVPTGQLLKSLIVTLLVPLILGKVLRDCFDSVAQYADKNRQSLSMISAMLLSLVPWMQVSRSRSLLLAVKPAVFAVSMAMATLLHFILLAWNIISVCSLSVIPGGGQSAFAKKENACAVILVASQKTLPVLVAVVEQLKGALGESGLLVLPCVAAHIIQIIIDSVLVNVWFKKELASKAEV